MHNKHVVEQLRERGAIFVEELDDSIPEGAVTVFSAHGVSPAVHAEADRRGLNTIDATCPLVTKVHREALKFAAEGYTIVLIGHDGHEEVEGTMGEAPEHIVLVETEADVDALEVADPEKLAYVSQTTLSVDETRAIIDRLRERFPSIVGPRTDDICYATTNRQAAVKQMAPHCDLVLVIGSRNSSNSNRLVEVAREHGADSHLIDSEEQVARGVAGGHARRRHHLGRQRARGARPAPGRLLPRPRHRAGRGVRGRPGGRALHAPQDDPPGPRRPVGVSLSDHARANRDRLGRQAADYEPAGRRHWADDEITWGTWEIPEASLRLAARGRRARRDRARLRHGLWPGRRSGGHPVTPRRRADPLRAGAVDDHGAGARVDEVQPVHAVVCAQLGRKLSTDSS